MLQDQLYALPKLKPCVQHTRNRLQQAMIELTAEKTFNNITVQDIAERADMNRATFYAHFEDKYVLLGYTVRKTFQDELEKRLPATPRLTSTNLRLFAVTVMDFMRKFIGRCYPSPYNTRYVYIAVQVRQHIN